MPTYRQIKKQILQQIADLKGREKERLMEELFQEHWGALRPYEFPLWVWWKMLDREAYPSIVHTPGVCGGDARLIRTRIPVWTLVRMRQLGLSESDILRSYPSLRAIDLVQAWSYAARYPEEIEKAIRENEEETRKALSPREGAEVAARPPTRSRED